MTGSRELHNTWLTDVTKRYIDWAIKEGFQVIDVNIPRIVAVEDPEVGYVKADDPGKRALQTRELATYLWDNYIEYVQEIGQRLSISNSVTPTGQTMPRKCS
jgi:histone deacetylase 6